MLGKFIKASLHLNVDVLQHDCENRTSIVNVFAMEAQFVCCKCKRQETEEKKYFGSCVLNPIYQIQSKKKKKQHIKFKKKMIKGICLMCTEA